MDARFVSILERLAVAAAELAALPWSDSFNAGYPAGLESFDEVAVEIGDWLRTQKNAASKARDEAVDPCTCESQGFCSWCLERDAQRAVEKRNADRIDGYDRDDLGPSEDSRDDEELDGAGFGDDES